MPDGDARQAIRRCALPRHRRLLHSSLFEECRHQQQRYAGHRMVLCLRSGPGASLRLGVVASRRLGGAVVRNRAKRRLREAFRLCRHMLSGQYDVILVARAGINQSSTAEVCKELLILAKRAGIFTGNTTPAIQNDTQTTPP